MNRPTQVTKAASVGAESKIRSTSYNGEKYSRQKVKLDMLIRLKVLLEALLEVCLEVRLEALLEVRLEVRLPKF